MSFNEQNCIHGSNTEGYDCTFMYRTDKPKKEYPAISDEGYQDIKKINIVLSLANDSHLKLNQGLFSG